MLVVHDHAVLLRKVERDVRRVQEVVSEPLLDHVLLVARAYNEFIEAEVTVPLHDVPEDRHAADLHHGLGPPLRLLRDARAQAARQKNCLQISISFADRMSSKTSSPSAADVQQRTPRTFIVNAYRLLNASIFAACPRTVRQAARSMALCRNTLAGAEEDPPRTNLYALP